MRTADEIAEHYAATKADDVLGFRGGVLLPYLTTEQLKPFVKPDADLSDWTPCPLDEAEALSDMRHYMEFAWGKARDHRGISASRSTEKMQAWLWLLEREDVLDAVRITTYQNYGAPQLRVICELMGFLIPEGSDLERMSRGLPCRDDCDEGCSH